MRSAPIKNYRRHFIQISYNSVQDVETFKPRLGWQHIVCVKFQFTHKLETQFYVRWQFKLLLRVDRFDVPTFTSAVFLGEMLITSRATNFSFPNAPQANWLIRFKKLSNFHLTKLENIDNFLLLIQNVILLCHSFWNSNVKPIKTVTRFALGKSVTSFVFIISFCVLVERYGEAIPSNGHHC